MQISSFQQLQRPSVLTACVELPVAMVNKSRYCLRFSSSITTNLEHLFFTVI